jgi:DNA polymerase-3 subunit beta
LTVAKEYAKTRAIPMPFISVNKTSIQSALTLANQVSPKKSDIDIFTYAKCRITKDTLTVASLQSHAYFKTSVPVQQSDLEAEIVLLIKADMFSSTVNTMNDDVISLEIDLAKHTLTLQGAKSKHTLRFDTDRVSDFVEPQEKPDELVVKFQVKTGDLMEANKVAFTTVGLPKNVYQPELLSFCYTVNPTDKNISVVSCDKFRISKTVLDTTIEHVSGDFGEAERNFLIQPKGVQLLQACISNEPVVSLNFEQSMIWVHTPNSTLVLRYGEGNFPDYNKIIPKSYTCHFSVNTEDARQALKQVYLTARTNVINKSLAMKVDPASNKITFNATSDDGFASESTVDIIGYEGVSEEWSQSFNTDYLMDYINLVTAENVVFDANPGKPMVLSPKDQKERQICMVQGLR